MTKKNSEFFSKFQISEPNKIILLHRNIPTIVVTQFIDLLTTFNWVLWSFLWDVLPRGICVIHEPSSSFVQIFVHQIWSTSLLFLSFSNDGGSCNLVTSRWESPLENRLPSNPNIAGRNMDKVLYQIQPMHPLPIFDATCSRYQRTRI